MVTGRKCGGTGSTKAEDTEDTSRQHGKPAIGTFQRCKARSIALTGKKGDDENGVERESLMHGLDGVNSNNNTTGGRATPTITTATTPVVDNNNQS
ncbi:hypothetical protein ASPBRDRAFT_45802 [Aspergillus brasiliensis CBS 101740]|uniref:Uncharacterized protein n=1 Tax=Aspergillus brasiliensis (strain CBS 101740 / IMI 381727 / IBT 21946) TaxID=767769 RepID=A0A1L9UCQ7_ASPBC|nr:hypothetical protein ASPBRDRAFT_45802 [Aspergillus brasiliensis CBS 101740]